jgi:hypothetical protein
MDITSFGSCKFQCMEKVLNGKGEIQLSRSLNVIEFGNFMYLINIV